MFDMYLRLMAMQLEIAALKKMSEKDFRKWKKRQTKNPV